MSQTEFATISDLSLHRVSNHIAKGEFGKAANLFVLAMTEFEEDADLIGFLSSQAERLDKENAIKLLLEIAEEMSWRCPQEYMTDDKRRKMIAFRDQSEHLYERFGYTIGGPGKDCHLNDTDKPGHIPVFLYAPKKKTGRQHPY